MIGALLRSKEQRAGGEDLLCFWVVCGMIFCCGGVSFLEKGYEAGCYFSGGFGGWC